MKRQTLITIGICICFLVLSGWFYMRSTAGSAPNTQEWISGRDTPAPSLTGDVSTGKDTADNGECAVYICGAVKNPGVYRFTGDARVCDAVEAAGGFRKKADRAAITQARPLNDGEQITIPKKGKNTGFAKKQSVGGGRESGLVNINQADLAELMTLAGIGEAKAQLIIDYRTENGSFASVEDIMKISGIKEGIYNRIKDQITV